MAEKHRRKFVGIAVGDTFSCFEDLKKKVEQVERQTEIPLKTRDCVTLKGAMKKRPNIVEMANPDLVYHSVQYICVFGRRDSQRDIKFMKQGVPPLAISQDSTCSAEIKVGLTEDRQHLRVKKIVDVHNHKVSQKLYKVVMGNRALNGSMKRYSANTSSSSAKRSKQETQQMKPLVKSSDSPKIHNIVRKKFKQSSVMSKAISPKQSNPSHAVKRKNQEKAKGPSPVVKRTKKEILTYSDFPGFAEAESDGESDDQQVQRKVSEQSRRRLGFKHLVEEMYNIEGAIVEVYEEGLKPQAIYFQTEEMRRSFASFPELLLIDSSFAIPHLGLTLYVVAIADGNGECNIVGFWCLTRETIKNLNFLMDAFTVHNPESSKVKVVMFDKEFSNRSVILSRFLDAVTFTCYHHAVRSFQKEVYAEEDIGFENEEERDTCMKLFKKMALAKDMGMYSLHFERFRLYSPASLYNCFLTEWHKIKHQWVDGLKDPNVYFLNQRQSKLSAINQIIKSVCDNFAAVPKFFHDLVRSISTLQLERQQRWLNVPVKGPLVTSEFHIAEMQYRNFLTPYGFTFVRRQMRSSTSIKIQESIDEHKCSIKSAKYGDLETSSKGCPCVFYTVTGLPCSHIFAVRRDKGLPTYEPSLCDKRWTLQYLRKANDLPNEDSDLVPDALFGYGELHQNDTTIDNTTPTENIEETFSNAGDDMSFVPSCSSSSVGAEMLSVNNNLEEELIIDEVDPDCELTLGFDDDILNESEDQNEEIVNMDLDSLLSKL